MGTLGNKPAAGFQSIEKQSITGNGGTSYALDHAVTNVNDLEVFVNNVRQEPTTAYTLSGQNIVMSEAIANTDSFYVIYQSRSFTKAVPADTSVTTAMIQDDAITSAKLDTNIAVAGTLGVSGDLTVDTNALFVDASANKVGINTTTLNNTLNVETAGYQALGIKRNTGVTTGTGEFAIHMETNSQTTIPYDDEGSVVFGTAVTPSTGAGFSEKVRIDSTGRVTIPNQPTFSFPSSTNYSISTTGATDMTSSNVLANVAAGTSTNVGNHFNTSNGRFTAPIAGVYEITLTGATILYSGYNYVYIRKNGGQLAYKPTNQDGDWMHFTIQVYIALAVGDYVNGQWNNNYSGGHVGHCHFSGRLVS